MTEEVQIRLGTSNDYEQLADIMYEAVHFGKTRYSPDQRQAWVPVRRSGSSWSERLAQQTIIVAERPSEIIGFMTHAPTGYIDFAYIRPSAQGSGAFRRLYQATEEEAVKKGLQRLWVHASLVAEPAFAAMGFSIVKKESVPIGDQSLDRFEMEKNL